MRFNICLVEYYNTATIAIYNDEVGTDDDYERHKPAQREDKLPKGKELIECPFTGEMMEVEVFEDPEDVFRRKMDSIEESIRRSKRNVLKLIRSMNLENAYFVTLTFDKAKVDRTDFEQCCKKTRVWLQNIRKQPGAENMSFLCVPELHKDMMSWHSHCILCDVGNIKLTDSNHKDRIGRTIYNLDKWRYGFSTAVKISSDPESSIKLAKYVTKYFTKESAMIAQKKHRYFASRNIPKPRVRKWFYEDCLDADRILEEIYEEGYQRVASNIHQGFMEIEYIDAIKIGKEGQYGERSSNLGKTSINNR